MSLAAHAYKLAFDDKLDAFLRECRDDANKLLGEGGGFGGVDEAEAELLDYLTAAAKERSKRR